MKDAQEGHWRARALIKDLTQGRSYIVNLNVNAVRSERARMDVTSAIGTGVASMVVGPEEVRYVLFDSKRFYFGKPDASVMRPILVIPFDPRWLHNVFFDIPLPAPTWNCTEKDGFLAECNDVKSGLKVTWSARKGPRKSILIEHAKASVQINVQDYASKVESRKGLFELEPPAGYQKLRVR